MPMCVQEVYAIVSVFHMIRIAVCECDSLCGAFRGPRMTLDKSHLMSVHLMNFATAHTKSLGDKSQQRGRSNYTTKMCWIFAYYFGHPQGTHHVCNYMCINIVVVCHSTLCPRLSFAFSDLFFGRSISCVGEDLRSTPRTLVVAKCTESHAQTYIYIYIVYSREHICI